MIRAVVFDLDGTITKPFLDFKVIREEIGVREDRTSLLDQIQLMSEAEKKRAWAILSRHEEAAVENAELNEGALELLSEVARRGLRSAIVTRNCHESTFACLEKFKINIERVITRDSGLPLKPDPAPLIFLSREWGIPASEILMVGDYRYDIESGRGAGALTCLVTNGRANADRAGADFVVAFPRDLGPVISELAGPGNRRDNDGSPQEEK